MKHLTTIVILLIATRAHAQDARDPGALMDTGLAAYQAGDYAAAIAAFRAAYASDERPAALFAMAQAERKSGDCAGAVADYDRFLATAPAERQAAAARDQRAICADKVAAATPAPAAADTRLAPPPPPAALSAPARRAPMRDAGPAWYRDPLADGLVGGAALGALCGAGFAIGSSSAAADANRADTYAVHASRADAAARDRDVAIGAFAGAAVLGGLAAWRILHREHHARDEREVAIVPGPGAVGLAIAGGF